MDTPSVSKTNVQGTCTHAIRTRSRREIFPPHPTIVVYTCTHTHPLSHTLVLTCQLSWSNLREKNTDAVSNRLSTPFTR